MVVVGGETLLPTGLLDSINMCAYSSVKNKNSIRVVIRVIFLTCFSAFFKKNVLKSKRMHANIPTVVISNPPSTGASGNGIVGHLQFFSFTFLLSEIVWNIEHIDCNSENKKHFTSRLVEAPSPPL